MRRSGAALTEPDAGSDAASCRTRATRGDGGWVISGQKMFISLGNCRAGAGVRPGQPERVPRARHHFLVPTSDDGYHAQEIHGKLGLRASDTASISLEGVEVPDDAMLGEVGDEFKVAMSALDNGRYSVAAGCVRICEGCVGDGLLLYRAQAVRGPGRALPARAGADRRDGDEARRRALLVRRTGILKDKGEPNTVETSIAKLYATEAAVGARTRRSRSTAAPRYVDDHPVERYLRDARVTTLCEGDLADPEVDHRTRSDRDRRDAADAGGRWIAPASSRRSVDGHVGLCRLNGPRCATRSRPR